MLCAARRYLQAGVQAKIWHPGARRCKTVDMSKAVCGEHVVVFGISLEACCFDAHCMGHR